MIRFTKNVEFDEESWDYGNSTGICVSIGEGDGMVRNAVSISRTKVLEPAIYATELVRSYLTEDDEDEGYDGVHIDESGQPFVWYRPILKPAVTRRYTDEELAENRSQAEAALHEWMERIYRAGLLLAEGRVVE